MTGRASSSALTLEWSLRSWECGKSLAVVAEKHGFYILISTAKSTRNVIAHGQSPEQGLVSVSQALSRMFPQRIKHTASL